MNAAREARLPRVQDTAGMLMLTDAHARAHNCRPIAAAFRPFA